MAKPKTRYVCQACGSVATAGRGNAPTAPNGTRWCRRAPRSSSIFAAKHNLQGGGRVIQLVGLDQPVALPERIATGIAEFDRAIGGGIVAGLGDAGRRRSRHRQVDLAAAGRGRPREQRAARSSMSRARKSAEQVRLRAVRLGLGEAPVQLAAATSVRDILTTLGGQAGRPCWSSIPSRPCTPT